MREDFTDWDMKGKVKSNQHTKLDREKFLLVESKATLDFLLKKFIARESIISN